MATPLMERLWLLSNEPQTKEDDKWGNKLAWAAAGAILSAGLGPVLTGALGSTAGSAAASAISNLCYATDADW